MDESQLLAVLADLEERISDIENEIYHSMPDAGYQRAVPDTSFKSVLRQLCDKILKISNAVSSEKPEYKFYVQVIHHAVVQAKDTVAPLDINIDKDWIMVVEEIQTLCHKMNVLDLISFAIDKRLSEICRSIAAATSIDRNANIKITRDKRNLAMLDLLKGIGMNLLHITKNGEKSDYFKFLGNTSSALMWEIITLLTGGQVGTMGR
jgi:hypothetical protein